MLRLSKLNNSSYQCNLQWSGRLLTAPFRISELIPLVYKLPSLNDIYGIISASEITEISLRSLSAVFPNRTDDRCSIRDVTLAYHIRFPVTVASITHVVIYSVEHKQSSVIHEPCRCLKIIFQGRARRKRRLMMVNKKHFKAAAGSPVCQPPLVQRNFC